jgi:hypothetical protein
VNDRLDSVVWRVFNDSVVVRAVERPAAAFKNAAAASTTVSRARRLWPVLRAHGGAALGTAAMVNIALTAAIGRPVGWQWLIVPAIALAAGAVLLMCDRRPSQ